MTTDTADMSAEEVTEVTEEQVQAAEEKLSKLEEGILREARMVVDSGDLSRTNADIYLTRIGLPNLPPKYTYTATLRLVQELTYQTRAVSEDAAREELDSLIQWDRERQRLSHASIQTHPDKQNELRIENTVITSNRPDEEPEEPEEPALYTENAPPAQKLVVLKARAEELGQAVTKIIADGKTNHNWHCDQVQETLKRLGLPPLPERKQWQVTYTVLTERHRAYSAYTEEEAKERALEEAKLRGYALASGVDVVVTAQS